jgi:hypothetical protein
MKRAGTDQTHGLRPGQSRGGDDGRRSTHGACGGECEARLDRADRLAFGVPWGLARRNQADAGGLFRVTRRTKFMRIASFRIEASRRVEAMAYFCEQPVLQFSTCRGFLGYQCLLHLEQGMLTGISKWSSLDALDASASVAACVLDGAKMSGATLAGEPSIHEELFDQESEVEVG